MLVKFLAHWSQRNPEAREQAVLEARRRRRLLAVRSGDRAREMEGLARGLSMSVDDLWVARSLLEAMVLPQCTNFGAVSPATKNGEVLISWNFDASLLLKLLMGSFPFFVQEVAGTIPYLCLGVPGLFGIGILNAEGLGCVVNAVGVTDGGEGISPFELNHQAMERCTTVKEAARIFRDNPRQTTRSMVFGLLMNWNMIWADRDGGLSVLEYSHNHFHEQEAGQEGIIASANHHQFLDRAKSGSFDPTGQAMITGSYSRLARMWALLREYQGRIDPMVAKVIVSDHLPDYSLLQEYGITGEWWQDKPDDGTICAHSWNLKKHLLKGEVFAALEENSWSTTLYSLQIQPLTHTVWFTNGHPCRKPSRPFGWARLLGAADEAPALAPAAACLPRPRKQLDRGDMFRRDAGPFRAFLAKVWFALIKVVEGAAFRKKS